MKFRHEYVVTLDKQALLVIRTRFMRSPEWQIQVRDALVASGVGMDDLLSRGLDVAQDLDRDGLTETAGHLRRLILAAA